VKPSANPRHMQRRIEREREGGIKLESIEKVEEEVK